MLNSLPQPEIDVLYQTASAFLADPRQGKIDLGIGVYRDENGISPVMACVQKAEQHLALTAITKAYLPLAGEPNFLRLMSELALGQPAPPNVATVQTVGGTGGVRLALELCQAANPRLKVHLGLPSWPNHKAICDRLGIPVEAYEYMEADKRAPSARNALAAVEGARPGDVLILHGPCHNPTGLDLSDAALREILSLAGERGVVPLIDAAYYGLGNDLESDLEHLRSLFSSTPECFLVMSGSKAFGLYRDRIGILFARCPDAAAAQRVQATAEKLARVNYSAPAAHGAQVIAHVLGDDELRQEWCTELETMRNRLSELRAAIRRRAEGFQPLQSIWESVGIFSLLPVFGSMTRLLAEEHAIYMPPTGRINVAGLSSNTVERFVSSFKDVTSRSIGEAAQYLERAR